MSGNTDMKIWFGKHKGKMVCDLPSSYIRWYLEEADNQNDELVEAMETEMHFRDQFNKHFEEDK